MSTTHEWGSQPEMFGPRHEHRLAMFTCETAKLAPGSRILDAAVGLGQLSGRLRKQGHNTFGVDGSFQAALYAKRTGAAQTVVADMSNLPFSDHAFDAVTSGETLEHLDDDSGAAAEISRVLGEGGTLIVTVPALESLWTRSDDYYEHRRRYRRKELVGLFETHGLNVERAEYWGFPVVLTYDTLFLLPMNIRRSKLAGRSGSGIESDAALSGIARAGSRRWLVNLVRGVFSLDSLFSWLPFGPGLLLVAKKTWGQA